MPDQVQRDAGAAVEHSAAAGEGARAGAGSPLSLDEVLREEQEVLRARPGRAPGPPTALCLSGGGIRSATFALGAIQGMAQAGVLSRFDYLSTVSGGGYIGSWLSAWAKRDGIAAVEKELAETSWNTRAGERAEPDPAPLRHLRDYSNYLTPRLGFLSADTWAALGTYLRNILLIWLVFIPCLAAILLVPTFCLWNISALPRGWVLWTARILGPALMLLACITAGVLASAHANACDPQKPPFRYTQAGFLLLVLLPLALSGTCVTTAFAWEDRPGLRALFVILFFGAVYAVGTIVPAVWLIARGEIGSERRYRLLAGSLLASLVAGGATGGGAALLSWVLSKETMPDSALYSCLAFPLYMMLQFAGASLYVGLTSQLSHALEEQVREWWARALGWMLVVALLWGAFSALTLYGAAVLAAGVSWALPLLASGGLAGAATILLGGSGATGGAPGTPGKPSRLRGLILAAAAPLFIAVLLSLIAWATQVLGGVQHWGPDWASLSPEPWFAAEQTIRTAVVGVGLLALSLVAGAVINVNKFSLQAFYRDRLTRAYLGASRERRPNPFSGFDTSDNFPMAALGSAVRAGTAPLHVINLALNVVRGSGLAWQERMALPFSVSPFHCGSCSLAPPAGSAATRGAYRPTASYGGPEGIMLGAAMAISGAAVSPNMGYHSSPALAFLLTLFNARLGWWLGNPARDRAHRPAPRSSLITILSEALGLTSDRGRYVYLSDGGHFENLGLYEMVLRRCRDIVVCDAGCDGACAFTDLGNAVRKVRIDLGVEIDFVTRPPAEVRLGPGKAGVYAAVAAITYRRRDGQEETGRLLYLKPVLDDTAPIDVRNYGRAREQFPHESTADQFFGESQFESYRALGEHLVTSLCGARVASAAEFIDRVEEAINRAAAADAVPRTTVIHTLAVPPRATPASAKP
ncbi:MAG: patatin-like phospholipase family protein [Phycisphaerales bacterium]